MIEAQSMPGDVASILIITEPTDRLFSHPRLLAGLLHLEGLNDLEAVNLDDFTPAMLEGRRAIVLGPADPAPLTVDALLEFVRDAGGGLICLSPGESLAARLGFEHEFRGVMDGRVAPRLAGFPECGVRIRGPASLLSPRAPLELIDQIELRAADGAATGSPAVSIIGHGRGKLAVVAFDLAAAVYLLRQGDPRLAAARTSGFARMRPADLFIAQADVEDAVYPHADLLCHLLRELLHTVWPDDSVLPWLWYFPDNADTAIALTSDDDWATRAQFETLIEGCLENDARLTFYLVRDSVVDRPWKQALEQQGFEFSIHPDLPPPTRAQMDATLTAHRRWFETTYASRPARSIRNHCITWCGYVEAARIEARHGFEVDCNYYSFPPRAPHYMAAAGLPLPLAPVHGEPLPILQLPTQYSDETVLPRPWGFSMNLSVHDAVNMLERAIRLNADSQHSMLCFNSHPESFRDYSAPMWRPTLALAKRLNIPVWPVGTLHDFWRRRRAVRLKPVPRRENFAQAASLSDGLVALLPTAPGYSGESRRVHGRDHAVVRHSAFMTNPPEPKRIQTR